jgi:hypothetical protein
VVARDAQGIALTELEQALAILEPPQQQEQGDPQQQPQQQAGEQEQGDSDQAAQPQPQPQRATDPAQLLQEVRDREAQRRRERAKQQAGYESVEKDW